MSKIFLILILFFITCKPHKSNIKINDGYYFGESRKGIISKYIVLIFVKDSTAILEAFIEEKGMVTAFNIFNKQKISPSSESFKLLKEDQQYFITNNLNQLIITQYKGDILINKPMDMKLKFYKELPLAKIPSRKHALYCYAWFYPHILLGIEDTINTECKVYMQNNMDLKLKRIDNQISYEQYYKILKDSLIQFKYNFDDLQKN